MKPKILIVDDEESIRNILKLMLSDEGYTVQTAEDGMKGFHMTGKMMPDIVLLDKNMPGIDGMQTLEKIKAKYPHIIVIMITAYGAVSSAVEAMKTGAYDYIEKPFDNDKMLMVIKRAVEHCKLSFENSTLRKSINERYSFDNIIGESIALKKVLDQVKCVSETDATVLIIGESGTGKELIAQAVHFNSQRKSKPIVAVNCGAIPNQLIESELFGHEKGAFTDAKEMQIGKFEQANEGTLFLDEISELPLDAQVKLLRVLEERKINRIGGKKTIPLDIRIISATNKNLEEKVQNGLFRLDLYYRLNIFTIALPALSERKEDIPVLTAHFIKKYNQKYKVNVNGCTKESMEMLMNYHWPGNIRDLENALQSALILAKSGNILPAHLPIRLQYPDIFEKTPSVSNIVGNIIEMSSMVEKETIINVLKQCNFNRTNASEILNVSRKTLFNKMKKYGLLD